MFFLFGESVKTHRNQTGMRRCDTCGGDKDFFHVTEVNYFSLFSIPLFEVSKVADYFLCGGCETSYASKDQIQPAHIEPVKIVIAYILAGYGRAGDTRHAQEIARAIGGIVFAVEEIEGTLRLIGEEDVLELLGRAASSMNPKAKFQVMQAAFLSVYVCCEMQYEDRLRINLMGNALGVSLTFVEAAMQNVRTNSYYGVRRLF